MRNDHISEILDNIPLSKLNERELARIREHIGHCSRCQQAFQAAQVSALLLHERAAAAVEVPPFFKTRLMATLREKQLAPESALWRMWRAAGWLVYSMAALVILLATLTFTQPGAPTSEAWPESAVGSNADPAEQVVFGTDNPANDDMNYGQVLTAIYYPEDER
jgi:predicted anti-sigma-YlaC factor YlaD